MNAYNLVFSPLARHDLNEIYQYGFRNWGATQASGYLNTLKDHFWNLTKQQKLVLNTESFCQTCEVFRSKDM